MLNKNLISKSCPLYLKFFSIVFLFILPGIIVRNKQKRAAPTIPCPIPTKIAKKDVEPAAVSAPAIVVKEKTPETGSPPLSPRRQHKSLLIDSLKEKQTRLETLNKARINMSRGIFDNATLSKIVPELSSKIDLTESPKGASMDGVVDDGDEPYSPGGIDNEPEAVNIVKAINAIDAVTANILSPTKNSTELQRKMDELNRQIAEQKQQIQSISSSFLGDTTPTLPVRIFNNALFFITRSIVNVFSLIDLSMYNKIYFYLPSCFPIVVTTARLDIVQPQNVRQLLLCT